MVEEGASFSLYMAHGGTNFGYWSGANGDQTSNGASSFKPDITSYDYSSPISETGDHNLGSDGGDLFAAVQQAICAASSRLACPEEPAPIPKEAYGEISLAESASLFAHLDRLQTCNHTVQDTFPTFEDLGQPSGFMLYRTSSLPTNRAISSQTLKFNSYNVHDRVQVFVDTALAGSAYRYAHAHVHAHPHASCMHVYFKRGERRHIRQGPLEGKGRLNHWLQGAMSIRMSLHMSLHMSVHMSLYMSLHMSLPMSWLAAPIGEMEM